MVDHPTETCVFCDEHLRFSASPFDRVLAESESAKIVPALGMMVPGYFLAISGRHVDAVADLNGDEIAAIYSWVGQVTSKWASQFGEYMIVEHGSCPGVKTGSCITHAHLHLVPMAAILTQTLLASKDVVWRKLPTLSALMQYSGRGYVSLQAGDEIWAATDVCLPSQWLRQRIAEELHLEVWDWALDPGHTQLDETLSHFAQEEIVRCA